MLKGEIVTEKASAGASSWNVELYNAKHEFVWKYGADLVSLLDPRAGERILDLGCGTGHLTAQIAESGAQVTGVDHSPDMVAAARAAYPNLKFVVSDARDLKFHNEFDAVFSNATLHWIQEPELALQGIQRALRPGGRLVAELGGKGNIRTMQEAFDQALIESGAASARGEVNPWYYPSVAEYAALAEKNGLEVRFATLFDRPTELADGASGLRNWMEMFSGAHLAKVGPGRREQFLQRVEDILRPKLFRDGSWCADYRRLRLVAVK